MANSGGKLDLTPVWMLIFIAAVAFAATFFIADLWIANGTTPILIPSLLWLVPVGIGVVVLVLAWQVRRYQQGKRHVDLMRAASTFVLCQAASRGGAIIGGIAGGLALAYAHTGPTMSLAPSMWELIFVVLGCIVLVGAAMVGERWCRVDDTDDDDDQPRGAQPA